MHGGTLITHQLRAMHAVVAARRAGLFRFGMQSRV